MKIKSITAEQIPAIVETVKASELKAHTDYLTEIGIVEPQTTELATLIAETVAGIYAAELGEKEDGEMPVDESAVVSDTPDEAKSLARKVVKAFTEIKAGSTFSGATKAKIAALNDSAAAHAKLAKALNDEATASKEESAPGPEVKEIDYADWIKLQK